MEATGATEEAKRGEIPQAGQRFMGTCISREQERKARWVVATTLQLQTPLEASRGLLTAGKVLPPILSLLPSLPALLPCSSPERFMEKTPNSPSPAVTVTPTERRFN